jgi:hypothetical protein
MRWDGVGDANSWWAVGRRWPCFHPIQDDGKTSGVSRISTTSAMLWREGFVVRESCQMRGGWEWDLLRDRR